MAEGWEDKDPFAGWEDTDPFADEAPPVVEEKPSVGDYAWRGVKAGAKFAGQAVAEVPQILYEGAGGTLSGLYRNAWRVAQGVPAVLGGMAGGASFGEAVEQANPVWDEINERGLPPTLGKNGSWLGQAAGAGMNALARAEAVKHGLRQGMSFEEAMERSKTSNILTENPRAVPFAADVLAMAGVPWLRRGAAVAAPVLRHPIQTAKQFHLTPEARAGRRWVDARKTLPEKLPQGAAEIDQIANELVAVGQAVKDLGVTETPWKADPNIRVQQLARERAQQDTTGNVAASEMGRTASARQQASKGLAKGFPVRGINPGIREFVKRKIESFVETTQGAFESDVAPSAPVENVSFAKGLLDRLRGNKKKGEITGSTAVSEAFAKEYSPFDKKIEAVAPSKFLEEALTKSDEATGNVLRNFIALKLKVEGRLGSATEALPENLPLKQWRELRGEFAKESKRLANNPDTAPAAKKMADMAEVAAEGEKTALVKLSPAEVEHYRKISEAYKQLKVGGFRTGRVQKVLEYGDEKTGGKYTAEQVLSSITDDASAARDFVAAFGSEKVALSGKSIVGVTDAEITALGRAEAQKVFRPVIEAEVAQIYKLAGGGDAGVKAVKAHLLKKGEVFETYGMDLDSVASAASKYDEGIARLSGANIKVAKDIAGSVLETDPNKIGGYVLDSPNVGGAYKNLVGVSKDASWKSVIDNLIGNELKKRIDAGVDVFTDVKSRAAMEQIFSPSQLSWLKKYHTIEKVLQREPANFRGPELISHPGKMAREVGGIAPVGLGKGYVAKYGAKLAAKIGLDVMDEAAYSWLDSAHIDSAKAKIIVEAYHGSRLARKEMMKGIEKERSAMKTLKNLVPKATPGAAATGIRNESQEAK